MAENDNIRKLTREDLQDGSFLKTVVAEFKEDQNKDNFVYALGVLRSSIVSIPCDVQFSEKAQEILDKHKEDATELTPEEHEIINQEMRILPKLLDKNGETTYLGVYSNDAEIEESQEGDIIHVHFFEAMDFAENFGDSGIDMVLNAFTDPFEVSKDLFESIRKLPSLIDEENEEEQNTESTEQITPTQNDTGFYMRVGKMDVFNYALHQNHVPPIRDIAIQNATEETIEGLSLRITSDFAFFKTFEAALPPIPSGKPISLPDPQLIIDGNTLASMTESVNTIITVELRKNEEVLCSCRGKMEVFAYDQWQGGESYQDMLSAFVVPNHPAIPALLHDAADRLKKWGKDASLEGYQSNDPNRVRELAAAIYAAVQKKNIVYANPPASFSIPGQRIRTPETIMEQRLGTCMDMTLLYAACLEAIGLHPLLVMMQGHIFAGVWLKERTHEEMMSAPIIIDNLEQLTMRINNGADEMTFIECTTMCSDKQISFEESEEHAKLGNLANRENFRFAIDVYSSRRYVTPIASRVKEGATYQIDVVDKTDKELTVAPTMLNISIADTQVKSTKIMGKRDLWESKLLDLSYRNMLLNLPRNASIQPIMSSHIDELEDALADGHEFQLYPVPNWLTDLAIVNKDENGKEGKPIQWLSVALKERGVFELTRWPAGADFDFNEKFRQEYRNHRLYTYCTQKQLDKELTSIYRAARSSQQENGVSSLYLAIGLLRWFIDEESTMPCYAPLILLPIEIIRKSANQGYALHARSEEPHFNTTLLEMLKQNYNIEIPGLEPLPADEHGTDIKKVFAIVRGALYNVKNWDVVESCVVGNFSFAQFAMWNDIHTAGDTLDNSKIVRSLMKGHVDWDITLPENVEEERTYLPITVDDTQLKAIEMAAKGATFVLHGPPGTGKSQTITGMIANLMAQGKSVLFVAEKMAALSVVQKRLASLGIGDFCLELHSDKANKKQVLSQLDKALTVMQPSKKTEYEEALKKTQESRAKLDGYAKHLHASHTCGYSLRELIDLYETVRAHDESVRFEYSHVKDLTQLDMKNHIGLIRQLMAAGESMENIAESPLLHVNLTSYNADIRTALNASMDQYPVALKTIMESSKPVADVFGKVEPSMKADFMELSSLVDLFFEKERTDETNLKLLDIGCDEAFAFFDYEARIRAEEDALLRIWMKEFLFEDMSVYLAKHEAAGKKIFGKGGAMAAVTAEIQKFTSNAITYEQIPLLLKQVSAFQLKRDDLQTAYNNLSEEVKALVTKFPTREQYQTAYLFAVAYKEDADKFPGGLAAITAISNNTEQRKAFVKYRDDFAQLKADEEQMNGLLVRDDIDTENWVEREIAFCQYMKEHPGALKEWSIYSSAREACRNAGLVPVIDAFEKNLISGDLIMAYKKGVYYSLINLIIDSDEVLSSFSGVTFNESIEQFKNLDEAMLQYAKDEIFYLLAARVPDAWESPEVGKELNLLRKAIGSNARGMSIRALFERIPHIIKALCPCMLMSPNSVAQYLAHDSELFDVVIFDEASQLPTCKAVGALSRAKNAVIVGDPKQMPPTTFFAGSGPEVDDLALDDLDSILDDALALGIPSQHLQWHYRSTHESLIAFSNNQFYENKMYTFPSANDRERHVTAVYVGGEYSKSTNVKEAEAVVAEIIRRFHDPVLNKQSIGVVTFNIKQQALIENLLAKQFQNNVELDNWANSGEDALFVKNLENVQGDERDVILFSIGYGPDEKGRISMNFGPINKTGGGKRLNVAFSRARVTMTIFTSLISSDIKITENSPDGLIAFREFLRFAEGHDIRCNAADKDAMAMKAGIMQSICKAVNEKGLQCETMIGHSDFRVDIAVVDPYEPTRYMMGILLDGDGYKQTENTRDREVAQIGVLSNLGWAIHRIWTIDWWDNRDKVLVRLEKELDSLKEAAEARDAERKAAEAAAAEELASRQAEEARLKEELSAQAAEVVAEDEELEEAYQESVAEEVTEEMPVTEPEAVVEGPEMVETETVSEQEENVVAEELVVAAEEIEAVEETTESGEEVAAEDTSVPAEPVEYVLTDYITAELESLKMTAADFAASGFKADLAQRALKIVSAEGPILKDSLLKKLFGSCGVSKTTATLEAAEKALKTAKIKNSKLKGVVFCWTPDQDPKAYAGIRVSAERSADEIPPQEIKNAACYVLKQKGVLEKDALVKEISVVFGYKRLGKNLDAVITAGIQYAKSSGAIISIPGGKFDIAPTE